MNKLDEIGNKNPFTVPENYFLNVNDEIMSRLPEKKKVVPEKVTMWKKIEPWFYMAAMFIGAFLRYKRCKTQQVRKVAHRKILLHLVMQMQARATGQMFRFRKRSFTNIWKNS